MKIKTMLVLLVVLCVSSVAHAAVFNVNSTKDNPDAKIGNGDCADFKGQCTLRAAIEEANNNPDDGGDVILLPSGEYVLNEFLEPLEIKGVLKIFGAGATKPQITGNKGVNIFVIDKDAVVLIHNVWLTEGKAELLGGAIQNFGTLKLVKVTIDKSESKSSSGGGIANCSGGNLTISESVIKDNNAIDEGGGIYNDKTSFLTITKTAITGNNAGYGGGVANHNIMKLEEVDISNNTVENHGGGVYNFIGKNAFINESTIANNVAVAEGGGIYNYNGALGITNSTISGNKASGSGGGIATVGKTNLSLTFVTLTDNEAADSGGGVRSIPPQGTVVDTTNVIGHTIVARNRLNGKMDVSGADCSGQLKSFGYNLLGNGDGCVLNIWNSDMVGTSTVLIDPMLTPLGEYGGPTKTHDLLPGSPAFDKDKDMCFVKIDQRKVERPKGNACDIGAVEYEGSALDAVKFPAKDSTRAKTPKPK